MAYDYYILKTYSSNTYIADSDNNNKVYYESAPVWVDKFLYPAKAGSFDRTLDGGAVLQQFSQGTVGLPISLEEGYMSTAQVITLKAKADTGNPVRFSEDNGSSYILCYFDYSRTPIEAEYVDEFKAMMKVNLYLRRAT